MGELGLDRGYRSFGRGFTRARVNLRLFYPQFSTYSQLLEANKFNQNPL